MQLKHECNSFAIHCFRQNSDSGKSESGSFGNEIPFLVSYAFQANEGRSHLLVLSVYFDSRKKKRKEKLGKEGGEEKQEKGVQFIT